MSPQAKLNYKRNICFLICVTVLNIPYLQMNGNYFLVHLYILL